MTTPTAQELQIGKTKTAAARPHEFTQATAAPEHYTVAARTAQTARANELAHDTLAVAGEIAGVAGTRLDRFQTLDEFVRELEG